MELCQVGGVQGLVPEDPVDGEVLLWLEGVRLRQAVQHPRTHRRCVGPKIDFFTRTSEAEPYLQFKFCIRQRYGSVFKYCGAGAGVAPLFSRLRLLLLMK